MSNEIDKLNSNFLNSDKNTIFFQKIGLLLGIDF